MPDEALPPLSAKTLARLEVAGLICSFASSLAVQANVGLREQRLTRRDRVLIGLALKVERSLLALIDDCRAQRAEAMHHLKTMAECFIYFHAVLHDQTETTARQLLAKVLQEEATFCRENPTEGGPTEVADIEALRAELVAGGLPPLPRLHELAERAQVRGWYSRVYRMACEPAHMGDVWEFMPFHGELIAVGGQPALAAARASDALWYGGQIALTIMRAILDNTSLNLQAPMEHLQRWFETGEAPAGSMSPPHPESRSG
jgi:hypothetical protein